MSNEIERAQKFMLRDVQEALEMYVNEPDTRKLLVGNLALREEPKKPDQKARADTKEVSLSRILKDGLNFSDSKSTPGFGEIVPEECMSLEQIRDHAKKLARK